MLLPERIRRGSKHARLRISFPVNWRVDRGYDRYPAYAASRLSRLEPRRSATVAALVNTRGLTELIALNVGLQAGLINQRLFTVLVLMALLTTRMTGPLLSAIRPVRAAAPAETVRLTST
jgi:hypothetical protein